MHKGGNKAFFFCLTDLVWNLGLFGKLNLETNSLEGGGTINNNNNNNKI